MKKSKLNNVVIIDNRECPRLNCGCEGRALWRDKLKSSARVVPRGECRGRKPNAVDSRF